MTAAADDSTTYTLYYRPDGAHESMIGRGLELGTAETIRRLLTGAVRIAPDAPEPCEGCGQPPRPHCPHCSRCDTCEDCGVCAGGDGCACDCEPTPGAAAGPLSAVGREPACGREGATGRPCPDHSPERLTAARQLPAENKRLAARATALERRVAELVVQRDDALAEIARAENDGDDTTTPDGAP